MTVSPTSSPQSTTISPAEDNAAPMLRPREVARVLSVGKSTVYDLMRSGALPSYRIGGSLRVRPEDLERFIASNRAEDRSRPRASRA